jgi:hypothetical protein
MSIPIDLYQYIYVYLKNIRDFLALAATCTSIRSQFNVELFHHRFQYEIGCVAYVCNRGNRLANCKGRLPSYMPLHVDVIKRNILTLACKCNNIDAFNTVTATGVPRMLEGIDYYVMLLNIAAEFGSYIIVDRLTSPPYNLGHDDACSVNICNGDALYYALKYNKYRVVHRLGQPPYNMSWKELGCYKSLVDKYIVQYRSRMKSILLRPPYVHVKDSEIT